MPESAPNAATDLRTLRSRVTELEATLDQLEQERDTRSRRRVRNLLAVGLLISAAFHIGLMIYLGLLVRWLPAGNSLQPTNIEFNFTTEDDLTSLESADLNDLVPEALTDVDTLPQDDPTADLSAEVPAADLEVAAAGAMPTLGGSGDGTGGDPTLNGGGGATTFFGVSSKGSRFAYIVDRSGSMRSDRRMEVALQELTRSISGLPDFAYFYVVFFSNSNAQLTPPMQQGWTRATRSNVTRFARWINGNVRPGGGTFPFSSFTEVLELDQRPDVIFFLTDGEIPDDTATQVAALNTRGTRVVINTIAFGDPSSQDQLRRIASESGGVYRFVPSVGGAP